MKKELPLITVALMMGFAASAGSIGFLALLFRDWELATFSLASLLASVLMIALRGRLGHSL